MDIEEKRAWAEEMMSEMYWAHKDKNPEMYDIAYPHTDSVTDCQCIIGALYRDKLAFIRKHGWAVNL